MSNKNTRNLSVHLYRRARMHLRRTSVKYWMSAGRTPGGRAVELPLETVNSEFLAYEQSRALYPLLISFICKKLACSIFMYSSWFDARFYSSFLLSGYRKSSHLFSWDILVHSIDVLGSSSECWHDKCLFEENKTCSSWLCGGFHRGMLLTPRSYFC